MPELNLKHEQRLLLRSQAHRLQPIVRLGAAGLSEAVLHEIDRALRTHGLIKVRAAGAQRADRDALWRAIAERLDAARVQVIGNIVVLFRPVAEASAPNTVAAAGHAAKLARSREKPGSSTQHKPAPPRHAPNRRSPQR